MDNKPNSLFDRHHKSLKEIPYERWTMANYSDCFDYLITIW